LCEAEDLDRLARDGTVTARVFMLATQALKIRSSPAAARKASREERDRVAPGVKCTSGHLRQLSIGDLKLPSGRIGVVGCVEQPIDLA